MTKPIVMIAPVDERPVDVDSDDRRAKLAKATLDAAGVVLKAHPECKLFLTNLWTPRTSTDIQPVHDHVHTAILTGDNEVTSEELGAFLDLIIPSLVKLRVSLLAPESELADKIGFRPGRKH